MTFPAGVTSVSFNITIINDNVLEDSETFNLIIANDSLPEIVTLGETYIMQVTILNFDGSSMSSTIVWNYVHRSTSGHGTYVYVLTHVKSTAIFNIYAPYASMYVSLIE